MATLAPSAAPPVDPDAESLPSQSLPGVIPGREPTIILNRVSKWYGDIVAVSDVSFGVAQGVTGLLGPNGAGKSTLLRTLTGLIRPAEGAVVVRGRPLAEDPTSARRELGFVGHESLLTPALTTAENLTLFGRLYGVPDPAHRAAELLDVVGLAGRANDLARTLSRGMTQRLALARALMHAPSVLLMDEPDAGLDLRAYAALRRVVRPDDGRSADGQAENGRAVVLVTHSLEHALDLCDSIAVLHGGRVRHVGPLAGLTVDDLRHLYEAMTAERVA